MNRSGLRRRVSVPTVTTQKFQSKDYEFTGGFDSNTSNDDVSSDKLRYISDAREIQIGKWETRKGNDFLSIPIGEVVNASQTSTTGNSQYNFNTTKWFAQKVIASATGRVTAIEANIRTTTNSTGTVILALYSDNGGSPYDELFKSSISASSVTNAFQYLKVRSITCPDVVAGLTYWVVGYVQYGATGDYQISTTTNATNGQTSNNTGMSYDATQYSFNVKLSTAPAGATKGCYRIERPNGSSYTFIAHNTDIYSVNELTGVTTSIDSSINANSTIVRFDYVGDVLRYVQVGFNAKPRKYNFTAASSVTTAPENASAIISHKGLEFFISADDSNKVFYTNFGIYDTFTSTDFFYVPSPKTSDPSVALSKLNGALYIHTRNNKYILQGSENSTFSLDNAIGQKGTFSQESVVYDEDYIYLASDDGIYRFNGAEEVNICQSVLDWWTGLANKNTTVLELHNNRLYIFYTPNGEGSNSRCKVYNVLYGIWESDDTKAYVSLSYASADQADYFIQASNRVGMLMLAEQPGNDYVTMGEPLNYDLRTSYNHYGAPAQYKRVSDYRPHFDSIPGGYDMQTGYAVDYRDIPVVSNVDLSGDGARFNTGKKFNTGLTFNTATQVNPTDLSPLIPGTWRRLQLRYSHYAAREPVSFDGHVLKIETQRLI